MDGAESLPGGGNGTYDIQNLMFNFFEVDRSEDDEAMSICDSFDEGHPDPEHAELYQAMGDLIDMPKYHSWLKLVAGTAKYNGKDVAQVFAQIIDRTDCRRRFHFEMSSPEPGDLTEFAWTLFNKRGNLRKELQCHDVHKGSGVWGEELNDGYLVLISYVRVDKEWRKKGIERRLIQGIEEMVATKWKTSYYFVEPGLLRNETQHVVEEKDDAITCLKTASDSFFRSLGYRRVGRTSFLCHTSITEHPSQSLSIEDDPDELNVPETGDFDEFQSALNDQSVLTPEGDDENALEYLTVPGKLAENYNFRIKDARMYTLLHLCARNPKPKTLNMLLTKPELSEYLESRNAFEETPLETLQDAMESFHEKIEAFAPGKWDGFPNRFLECKRQLQLAMGHSITASDEHSVEALREKYGCECGQCIDGVFSPRMMFELKNAAEYGYDLLSQDMDAFYYESARPDCPYYDEYLFDPASSFFGLDYLPASLRREIKHHKGAKEGYLGAVEAVRHCLRENKVPSTDNVRNYVGKSLYTTFGGKLEYAIDFVIGLSKSKNLVHGGWDAQEEYLGQSLGEGPNEVRQQLEKLPRCPVNDDNFDLVRRKVFVAGEYVNGPYPEEDYRSLFSRRVLVGPETMVGN
ncbi:hypothetical protein K440DRAFT_609851 [Wilcoxina mikolae CBS 423.85]|nr:hypothetical protein K440DRAFT_609851 [Wilcoxina mikolae CBS 423.85]